MTLSNKIMVFVISLVFLLGGLTIGVYTYFINESMLALQKNWSSLVSQSVAESIATHVVNKNILQIKQTLNPIVSENNDIEYAFVTNFEGDIIAYTFEDKYVTYFQHIEEEKNNKTHKKIIFNDREIVGFSYPIVKGLSAHVHLGVNNYSIIESQNSLIKNILIFYGIVGVLSILIGHMIGIRITRPISNIIEQISRFGRNETGGKLQVNSTDTTINNLVATFNHMAEQHAISEQELRASEESTRLLLNHIGEAVYGIDMNGACTFANPACVRMLGYNSMSALLGKNMHQLMHHHQEDGSVYPEQECRIYKAHKEEKRSHVSDEVFWRKDGSAFPVEYWSDPLYRQGEVTGSVVSFIDITERKRSEKALKQSRESLAEAQRISDMGNWEWNIQTGELSWSDHIFRIFGLEPGAVLPTYDLFIECVHPDDRELVKKTVQDSLDSGEDYDIEHRIIYPDKTVRIIHERGRIYYKDGKPSRMLGTVHDITEQHTANSKMSMLSSALEQSADIVLITDSKGIVEYVNPAFEKITGYTKDEVIGKTPSMLKSGEMDDEFYSQLWEKILTGKSFTDIFINKKKDGTFYYEEKTITQLKDAKGKLTHFISTGKDITERMEAQERLRHMAHHDALTGLPNRILLMDRLEQATSRARWNDRIVGVMFLDMDRFKTINDTLGHEVGDSLLKQMSLRLSDCVRDGDTVARLGGDEFAIILNDMASDDDISPFAQKIIDALSVPFTINEHELFVTISIGVCIFPEDGDDAKTLLKKADVAMYRAKASGRNNYQFYTDEDNAKALERLKLENDLRRALERNEFRLHFQPQLDLHEGKLAGMEVLLRWHHPEHGVVSPDTFIPLLEETGLIIPVGEWVIRTACRHARTWLDAGLHFKRIAVNISVRQFAQQGLVERIKTILDEERLGAHFLELEITEGLLVENITETSRILEELHKMGVYISIDDFGTGYSSMNYLKRLPVDSLKIDYSFVRDITLDPEDATIASAIVTLAHSLGLTVIAEGVETLEQLNFLLNEGCDQIQGFLFSPPLPVEAVQPLVLEGALHWEWEHILQERRWNDKNKKRG